MNGWEIETPRCPDCDDCEHEEKQHRRKVWVDGKEKIRTEAGRCGVEGCDCKHYSRGGR